MATRLRSLVIAAGLILTSWAFCVAASPVPLVSLHTQKMPIAELLQQLATMQGVNIVVADQVQGEVSVALDKVPWQQAFTTLIEQNQLHALQQGKVWSVMTEQQWQMREKQHQQTLQPLFWPVHYADAKVLAELVRKQSGLLSKQGKISVDQRTNTLVIYDHQQQVQVLRPFLQHLDVPVKQVLIQAKIAIVDRNAFKEMGIKLSQSSASHRVASVSGVGLDMGLTNPAGVLGLALGTLPNGSLLDLQLQALQSHGKGKILSAPKLVVANKQQAYIEQGDEVPFNTSTPSGATQVEFKKAVLGLYVTPQITSKGSVYLKLKVSKDFVTKDKGAAGDIPIIATSVMQTQVLVKDQQTLVLGGILNQEQRDDVKSVPWLGRLPVLGWLFRNSSHSDQQAELVIFVTPKILR